MALFFAHITFQIRRGFRSRIFFELKTLPSFFYSLVIGFLRLKLWQHRPSPLFPLPGEEDSLIECHCRVDNFSSLEGIMGRGKVSSAPTVFSIIDTSKTNKFH